MNNLQCNRIYRNGSIVILFPNLSKEVSLPAVKHRYLTVPSHNRHSTFSYPLESDAILTVKHERG